MKHCTNCGLPIAQDVTTCPRCGTFVPYTSTKLPAIDSATGTTISTTPPSFDTQGSRTDAETPQLGFEPTQESNLPSSPMHPVYQEYPNVPSTSFSQNGGTEPAMPAVQLEAQTPRYPTPPPQTPTPLPPPYIAQQPSPLFLTPPPAPQSGGAFPMNYMDARQAPMYSTPYPPQPQMPYPPQPQIPYVPQPQTKKGLSRGIVALILIVALLLIFSGVGLIYYSAVARPEQLHAQATATAQTILTNDARATNVANTQATGTAVAYSNATATAQAQATAQVQATATALQAIYTQATQGTPALSSSLAAQDNNNWDVNDTTDGGGCGFNAGTYHSTLFSKNFYFPCFARASNFSNFAFQAQMTINQGDEGGLVFRSNSDSDLAQYYLFSITQMGSYRLVVSKDGTNNTTLTEDASTAIKTGVGQLNTLAVVAKGSTLYLYINKQYVGSASDSTYSSGMLGVFASDASTTTDVSFSNAKVWAL